MSINYTSTGYSAKQFLALLAIAMLAAATPAIRNSGKGPCPKMLILRARWRARIIYSETLPTSQVFALDRPHYDERDRDLFSGIDASAGRYVPVVT